MKHPWKVMLGGCGAAAILACGDAAGPTEVTLTNLIGTWTATEIVYTNQSDPSQSVDIVPMGGAYEFTIGADGQYSGSFTWPGGSPNSHRGTVTVRNDSLLYDDDDNYESDMWFACSLSGNVLELSTFMHLENGDLGFTSETFEIPTTFEVTAERD